MRIISPVVAHPPAPDTVKIRFTLAQYLCIMPENIILLAVPYLTERILMYITEGHAVCFATRADIPVGGDSHSGPSSVAGDIVYIIAVINPLAGAAVSEALFQLVKLCRAKMPARPAVKREILSPPCASSPVKFDSRSSSRSFFIIA